MFSNVTLNSTSYLKNEKINITITNTLENDQEINVFINSNFRLDIVEYDINNGEIPIFYQSIPIQEFKQLIELKIDLSSLNSGIYGISRILVSKIDNPSERILTNISGQIYFQLRNNKEPIKTYEEIIKVKDQILCESYNYYISGIGRISDPTAKRYQFFVFCSDIRAEAKCRIEKIDIIPYDGLKDNDIIESMKTFTSQLPIEEFDQLITSNNHIQGSIIHFVNVSANSIDESINMVIRYSKMVLCSYSIHNMSYGTIIGMTIIDKKNKTIEYRATPNIYRGNLVNSFQIPIKNLSKMIINGLSKPIANYYLQMYLQCIKEKFSQFTYFRLWNLLESMARNKKFKNKYRIDETGKLIKSKEGKRIDISAHARSLVYELIRSSFFNAGIMQELSLSPLKQNDLENRTIIWYQRRNCIVHKGGCQYDNIQYCNCNDSRMQTCRSAYEETVNKNGLSIDVFDEYLFDFIDITKKTVLIELNSYNED